MNKKTFLLASALTCFVLTGCKPSVTKPTSLHINGQPICQINEEVTFTVNIDPSEADKSVTWSVSNDLATIDSNGVFKAKNTAGEVEVIAVSKTNTSLQDKMTVYIIDSSSEKTAFLNAYDTYYKKLKNNKALRINADHLANDHIYINEELYEGEQFTTIYNLEDSDDITIDCKPVGKDEITSLVILDKDTLSSTLDYIDRKKSEGCFYYLRKDATSNDLAYLIYTNEGYAYFNIGEDGYINNMMAGKDDITLYDLSLTEKPETFDKEISIRPLKNFVVPNDVVQFEATISGTGEKYSDVKWTVDCDEQVILNKISISSNGLFTIGDLTQEEEETYVGTIINIKATPYVDKGKTETAPLILASNKKDREAFLSKYEELYNKLLLGPALVIPNEFDSEDFSYQDPEHPKEKFKEVKYDLRGNSVGIDFASEHHRGIVHVPNKNELEDDFAQVDIIKAMGGEGDVYFYMDNDGSIFYYLHTSLQNENLTRYAEIDSNGYYRTYYQIDNDIETISLHLTPKPYVAPTKNEISIKSQEGKHASEYKVGDKDVLSFEVPTGKCDKAFWASADESIAYIEPETGELVCHKAGTVEIRATSWANKYVVIKFDITIS